jgi:hypothetical protein
MPKKSGLGRQDDFNFGASKPKKIKDVSELRQTDKVSFYLKSNIKLPQDPCDSVHINDIPNLNIIGKPGRQTGSSVDYDPVQQKNYLSISARYDRSLWLSPSKIERRGNKTVYLFCSSGSPTGFWEVVVEGGGTYIRFLPNVLTIICPRPFRLQELVQVETDGDSFIWTQLQGRDTIVFPSDGTEGSLNPIISVIGIRTAVDPPVLLNAELADNPEAFAILAIRTTIAEIIEGVAGAGEVAPNGEPELKIPCRLTPAPAIPGSASQWNDGDLEVTWGLPGTHLPWVSEYWLQENATGNYQTVRASTIPLASVQKGRYYRVLTIFNPLSSGFFASESCRFYFPLFASPVIAADSIPGLSGSAGDEIITQYPLAVFTCPISTNDIDGLSGSAGDEIITQYPLAVFTCPISTDSINGLSGSAATTEVKVYDLTGGIVG